MRHGSPRGLCRNSPTCALRWRNFVTTLLDTLTSLDAALDVLDDTSAHETVSATIPHLSGGVGRRQAELTKIAGRYTAPPLPGPAGPIDRWPKVIAILDRLVERVGS